MDVFRFNDAFNMARCSLKDEMIVRELARQYAELAHSERNVKALTLHQKVNDLEMERPVVLIDELPWGELSCEELKLVCEDPLARSLENQFRRTLFKAKYMRADMVVPPYVGVGKMILSTGNGLVIDETTIKGGEEQSIMAHEYHDILATEEDLEKIRMPEISYDEASTMAKYERVYDLVGGVIPVQLKGRDYFGVVTWDNVARYRGVTNLLLDLADRPEFLHKLVRKLTDVEKCQLDQLEALGLFDADPYSLHCTAARTKDLPSSEYRGGPPTRKDIWGRGAAQIFAHVSKDMHEEFDIAYMKETVGQCGLVYYGCCEPLDKKIDIVEQIPNLRKISITPWADVDHAAEVMGDRYVMAIKPNPAAVAVTKTDPQELRKEIGRILSAVERHGCSCDIVLKDISTCHHRPENLFEWEKVVMEMVTSS